MKVREIRHVRIIELRGMALRGAPLEQLNAKCVSWGISKGTAQSYIDEVVESLQKVAKKNV